ncbi:hypothetical protein NQ317_012787, partial [Molorchus minor]
PQSPWNVFLSTNGTLTWTPSPHETCELAYYIVHIVLYYSDPVEEWEYEVAELTMDASHLEKCQWFAFQVSAVSIDGVRGSAGVIDQVTPPPSEADLTLDYLNATSSGRHIYLQWGLPEEWASCAYRYRVAAYNEDDDTVVDRYGIMNTMTVIGLIPCAQYTFSVTAIFNLEEEGPPLVVRHAAPEVGGETTIPNLLDLDVTSTSINLTLELESLQVNRCPIYNLDVDASPWFNTSYQITDQESRTPFSISWTDLRADSLYYLRPSTVRNLRLSANNTLSWDPPLNENCEIAHYLVYVLLLDSDPAQYWTYDVTERSLDTSHLEGMSKIFISDKASVHGQRGGVCGTYQHRYSTTICSYNLLSWTYWLARRRSERYELSDLFLAIQYVQEKANLEINYVNVTTSERNVVLEWALDQEWSSCAQRYRIVLYNEDDDAATDLYTSSNSLTVSSLIPCATYTITVRAIFNLEEEGPPYVVKQDAPEFVTDTPTLLDYKVTSTSIDLTFRLQTLENNRCPIYSLDVNASPWFNTSYQITDQNNRTPFSINLTDLTPNSLYYFRVSANNSAGVTLPFQVAFQTLEN